MRGMLCCAPGCYQRDAAPVAGVPLCPGHTAAVAEVLQPPKQRKVSDQMRGLLADDHVVYYIGWSERPDIVKIGTTMDLRERVTALRWQMNRPGRRDGQYGEPIVLATEHGGIKVERHRHRQFKHLRIEARHEFFRRASDLDAHISLLPRCKPA